MRLFVDVGTGKFIASPGFGTAAASYDFKRGDEGDIRVAFYDGTAGVLLPADTEIFFEAKESGEYEADPLIQVASFTRPAEAGGDYLGAPTFNTSRLAEIFGDDGLPGNDKVSVAVMVEVSWREPGKGWRSTNTAAGEIANDVIKEDGGLLPVIEKEVSGIPSVGSFLVVDTGAMVNQVGSLVISGWTLGLHAEDGAAHAHTGAVLSWTGAKAWSEIFVEVVKVVNGSGGLSGDFTLTNDPGAHPSVTAEMLVEVDDDVEVTLTANEVGRQGDLISFYFSDSNQGFDVTGALAGGLDPRNVSVNDVFNLLQESFSAAELAGYLSRFQQVMASDPAGIRATIQAASAATVAALEGAVNNGRRGYLTKAAMDADLVPDDGSLAEVVSDPTPANNGVYVKNGATGAGTWDASTSDLESRLAAVEDVFDTGVTGYHFVIVDDADQIVAFWNADGDLQSNYVTDSIPNDALALVDERDGYTGYEVVWVDDNERILGGFYRNGIPLEADLEDPEGVALIGSPGAPSIGVWGDELSDGTFGPRLSAVTGSTVTSHATAGDEAHAIAERFLARGGEEDVLIFWIGRNDHQLDMPGRVLWHLERMIADLPLNHKWLVMAPVPVNYDRDPGVGVTRNDILADPEGQALVELRDRLARKYGERFVDAQAAVRDRYDYGGWYVTATFTQPTFNGVVVVEVNDTTGLQIGEEYRMGDLDREGDYYLINSINAGLNQITVQWTGVGSGVTVAAGEDVGPVARPSGYDRPLRLILKADVDYQVEEWLPASLQNAELWEQAGYELVADALEDRMRELGWVS